MVEVPNIQTSKTNREPFRLAMAVKRSDEYMQPFRKRRAEFMTELAGPLYGRKMDDASVRRPLNNLFSMAATLIPYLTWRNVRLNVTGDPELQWFSDMLGKRTEHVLDETRAAEAIRYAAQDALYGLGTIMTGLAASDNVHSLNTENDDYRYDQGKPFVDAIDFDDRILDCRVHLASRMAFDGDRFRMRLEVALDKSSRFDAKAKKTIEAMYKRQQELKAKQGQVGGRPEGSGQDDDFDPEVEFIRLWIPRQNRSVVIPSMLDAVNEETDYLAVTDHTMPEGAPMPEFGPYDNIGFYGLNGNIMPIPLLAVVWDLHDMLNTVAVTAAKRAENQKSLLLTDETVDPTEAASIQTAMDGARVNVQNVDRYKMVEFGGKPEQGFPAMTWMQAEFNRHAGNMDTLGGLSSQAGTLGQEQMLMANASVRLNDMQAEMHERVARTVRKVAWYVWTDTEFSGSMDVGGSSAWWSPETREGDFVDYQFKIDPYAGKPSSPTEQYQKLERAFATFIGPREQAMAAQGLMVDTKVLLGAVSRVMDMPELEQMVTEMPQMEQPVEAGESGGMTINETSNVSLGGRGRPQPASDQGE